MAGGAATLVRMTREQYLAAERASSEKHILWDGAVYAMAGASLAHNAIVANLVIALGTRLDRSACRPYPSDLRVRIPGSDRYVYPDATVVCGRAQLEDEHHDVLLNPTVVIEVLSAGTEAFDRGEKFAAYRTITSMQSFVLISQDQQRVEIYTRGPEGVWSFREHRGGDVTLALGNERTVALPIDALYAGVELSG
ncbi:Uma2 family endonuclease [Sandaracinus amylolyticus]|uniref:Putative restriction endonuclease domain-containing protein n=1 Tax=Sandaracinus amylolyticus TaxID=927083 RepID=A0A0F6W8V4_9BACT|nr:Uma2 family endonuclease [Sandaracinus amylolyticus]AKF10367.1 hypothetical protein DB32_007516 [Sandaracinus amylolyticus]